MKKVLKKQTIERKIGGKVGFALLILTTLFFAMGCQRRQATTDGVTRIIVADARSTHHLNLYVAQELGFFERHNLEVEIVQVTSLAAARDMVTSGRADVFWACPTVGMAAIANGAPITTIAQVKIPCTSVLLVPEDSPIVELSDLQGRSISGISPTCEAVISLAVAAREAGAEFNLERLGGGASIMALQARRVDGAILEEPYASIAELAGFVRVFDEISASIPCRTISVGNRFLANNTPALKRLIEAVAEANDYINKNPIAEHIVEIAHLYTGAPKDAIILGNHRLLFTIELDTDGLILLGDELLAAGYIRQNPGYTQFAEAFRGITWGIESTEYEVE